MEVHDLDNFILVIYDEEHCMTVGRKHPAYAEWAAKVNQEKQLDLIGLDSVQDS